MVDTIARDATTTANLSVGSSASSFIDQNDLSGNVIDTDYFRVTLTVGHTYQFTGNANVSLADTLDALFMRIRDSAGNLLVPDISSDSATPFFSFTPNSSGTYYLAVSAGGTGAFQDKTGDYTVALSDITPPPQTPDLVASLNSVSTTSALAGSSINVNYTISNIGAAAAANSFGLVFLSPDATFGDANDIALNAVSLPSTGSLGSGGSITQSQSVALPNFLSAGNYFIAIKADGLSNVGESNEGNNFSSGQTITITNPTPLPFISIADASVGEGGTLNFAVSLDKVWATDVVVNFNVTGGTATSGSDYFAPGSSSVTIHAGSLSANASINTINDGVAEPNETVTLQIFGPLGANLGSKTTATGTILDGGGVVVTPPGTSHWYQTVVTRDYAPNINAGLHTPNATYMDEIGLGIPTGLTPFDQPSLASQPVKDLLVSDDIDPTNDVVTATGIAPAVASLKQIFARINADHPDLMPLLASAGSLSVRTQHPTNGLPTTAISNHAWGCAIDLKMIGRAPDGLVPADADGKTYEGIATIIKYFNEAGWVSGAGYAIGTDDDMHFEVSKEKLAEWFTRAPTFTASSDTFSLPTSGGTYHAGAGNDVMIGSHSRDKLFGDAGNDSLFGLAGKDTLSGGAGLDRLVGGLAKDLLTGGAGKDIFGYNSVKDSTKGATHDVITDFKHGSDQIDLSAIDANSKKSGDQKFTFLFTADFHHKAGELHYRYEGGTHTLIEGDVNGDGRADFQIELTGLKTLTKGDFVL